VNDIVGELRSLNSLPILLPFANYTDFEVGKLNEEVRQATRSRRC
jgi:hypothetical protein